MSLTPFNFLRIAQFHSRNVAELGRFAMALRPNDRSDLVHYSSNIWPFMWKVVMGKKKKVSKRWWNTSTLKNRVITGDHRTVYTEFKKLMVPKVMSKELVAHYDKRFMRDVPAPAVEPRPILSLDYDSSKSQYTVNKLDHNEININLLESKLKRAKETPLPIHRGYVIGAKRKKIEKLQAKIKKLRKENVVYRDVFRKKRQCKFYIKELKPLPKKKG